MTAKSYTDPTLISDKAHPFKSIHMNSSSSGSFESQDQFHRRVIKLSKTGNLKGVKSTLKCLENVNLLDSEGRNLLHQLIDSSQPAVEKKLEIIPIFIKYGVCINLKDSNGWTPLLSASSQASLLLCEKLLKLGADPSLSNEDLSTPLHYLVRHSFSEDEKLLREVVELFKKKGADLNFKNSFEETPLHLACLQGDERFVRILINSGAEPNLWDMKGRTALHCAVRCNRIPCVQILIGFGVSFELRYSETHPTSKELAESLNLTSILKMFYAKDCTEYSLNILVNEEEDYKIFLEFLKKEFSNENLEFWNQVRVFKSIQDDQKRDLEGVKLYENWINSDELNITGASKKEIIAMFEQCGGKRIPIEIFDGAVIDVWMNMRDSYTRFVKTSDYQRLVDKYRDFNNMINSKSLSPRKGSGNKLKGILHI